MHVSFALTKVEPWSRYPQDMSSPLSGSTTLVYEPVLHLIRKEAAPAITALRLLRIHTTIEKMG